jgi:ArsR family transcriptional regulator
MERLETKAEDVARTLRAMSNPRRLLILCKLAEGGTMSVGSLTEAIGISQSALSQHLAVMRDEHLLAFDRDGQTLNYRIADKRLETLLSQLYQIYCAPDDGEKG